MRWWVAMTPVKKNQRKARPAAMAPRPAETSSENLRAACQTLNPNLGAAPYGNSIARP